MDGQRANKKPKRFSRIENLAKARGVKQQKSDRPESVLLEKITKTIQNIYDFDLVINQPKYQII